jgi:hypothetical protein
VNPGGDERFPLLIPAVLLIIGGEPRWWWKVPTSYTRRVTHHWGWTQVVMKGSHFLYRPCYSSLGVNPGGDERFPLLIPAVLLIYSTSVIVFSVIDNHKRGERLFCSWSICLNLYVSCDYYLLPPLIFFFFNQI